MKEAVKIFFLCSMFIIVNHVMAEGYGTIASQHKNKHGKWICTTNASSAASGSPEDKADKKMANKATRGKSAFDFALKHCRDCTKITCDLQTSSQ